MRSLRAKTKYFNISSPIKFVENFNSFCTQHEMLLLQDENNGGGGGRREGGGGRGGEGGGRGGGGGEGGWTRRRFNNYDQTPVAVAPPRVDDVKDFPSLG